MPNLPIFTHRKTRPPTPDHISLFTTNNTITKMKHTPILILLALIFTTSCIPRKRLIYFQDQGTAMDTTDDGYMKITRAMYKLQQGDMLLISIKSLDEEANKLFEEADFGGMQGGGMGGGVGGDFIFFLQGQTIDSDGKINIPILGRIQVEGLTEEEIQRTIDKRLSLYFKESTVFSRVRQAGIRFSIVGEVHNPGRHVILAPYVNIMEAIAYAGDIAVVGDRRKVEIFRQYPDGLRRYEVDLTDQSVINNPLFFIQPNDIIQVKPLRQKTFGFGITGRETFTTSMSIISSTLSLITVLILLQQNSG